ncbi:MAG: BON domain-containing protein, partial [Pseudobdellovibrionaceae bacterium]
MFGKNRQGRSENQGSNFRPQRRMENDSDSFNSDSRSYSDYSSFEGTSDRPYYGGEEGRFPYGASSEYPQNRNSWNADERNYSGNWMRGEHVGKGPKGYRRSDSRINEEVSDILTQHGDIDASEIEVDVKEGVVTLSGTVQNRRIKRMVEDLAENVNG